MKNQKTFNVAMEVLWLAVVFFLPLVFFPNIYTTFELAKVTVFQSIAALLGALWVAKYLRMGVWPKTPQWPRVLFLSFFVFLGMYLLAVVFSVAPALSVFGSYPRFQGLLTVGAYLIFGVVIFFELRSKEQRERLILVLMASFFVVCLVALMQKFLPGFLGTWNDAEFMGRIYGTMGNPNYLATYIVLLLPLVVVLIFTNVRNFVRIFAGVCVFVGLLTLIFTLSRAGFLACSLSLLTMAVIVAVKKHAKKSLVALGVLTLVGLSFWAFIIAHQHEPWVTNNPLFNRLTLNETTISSTQTRLEIWPAALQQALSSPITGFGPETFAVTFPAYAPSSVNSREDAGEIADHPHNEFLDWAVQIGFVGAVAFVIFVMGLVVVGVRKYLREGDVLALSFATGILGLFIANQFGFSVTVHWVYLTLFAVLVVSSGDVKLEVVKIHKVFKVVMFLVVVCAAGAMWFYDARMILADIHMRRGYTAAIGSDLPKTASEYRQAFETASLQPFYGLNFAYAELQRLQDGENLSAVEKVAAHDAAEKAALLRGNDKFSLEILSDLNKFL